MFSEPLVREAALLLLAWLLGGLIGWQREAQGRAAGLRTHMLVAGGACLISLVSFGTHDPGRIAAQIVTGIGFLGAGVILRRGVSVRGLTTAATIWVVAGIGIAVGAGAVEGRFAALGTIGAILFFITLTAVKAVEDRIVRIRRDVTLMIHLPRNKGSVARLIETLTETGGQIMGLQTEETMDEENRRLITLHLRLPQDVTQESISRVVAINFPGAETQWEVE